MDCKFFPCSVGVRCDGVNKYCIASISSQGKKRVQTFKRKNRALFFDFPFVRGVLFLIYGFVSFFTAFDFALIDDEILTEKEERTKRNKIILFAIVSGLVVVFWVLILGYLPSKLSFLIMGYSDSTILRNFLIALLKVAIMFLFFVVLRFIPSMVELYKFNGACNLVQEKKEKVFLHYPLNFLNFALFSFLFSIFVITFIGVSINFWADLLINLGIFIFCVSVGYEFLNLISKNEKLSKICVATSFLVVSRPNTTHKELARFAYLEFVSGRKVKEKSSDKISMSLVRSEMESKLNKSGKKEKSDIDWIIATVLHKNRAEIKLVQSVSEREYREIIKATEERAKGKPLSAIFGFVEFYGLKFSVNKKVLSPRMETEVLVENVLLEIKKNKKAKVLDVGTGSGAIAISIAKFSNAEVSAVDISKGALETATQNAKTLGCKINFMQSDMFSGLKKKQKYDIIVSNPPYIRTLDIEGLDAEVKNYDPRLALDGGNDGLDFYRIIAVDAPKHLNKNGKIFLEIGKGQFTSVKKLLEKSGFLEIKGIKDYGKITRVVKAVWKK